MSMPKGTKFKSGYATVTDQGLGYREIAEVMTSEGHKMNHATARNYFLRAMEKLAEPIAQQSGRTVREIARDPRFQIALAEILRNSKNDRIDI